MHSLLEDVPSFPVKLRDHLSMLDEPFVAIVLKHGVRDYLCERGYLQVRGGGLEIISEIFIRFLVGQVRIRRTCKSMASRIGFGPEAKPIRIPAERILERLSKRSTRPTSPSSSSRAKYEGGRVALP